METLKKVTKSFVNDKKILIESINSLLSPKNLFLFLSPLIGFVLGPFAI